MNGYVFWTLTVLGMMLLLLLFSAWLDRRHQKFADKIREEKEKEEKDGLH